MKRWLVEKGWACFFQFFPITLFIILLFSRVQGHGRFCGCFKDGDISFTFSIGDGFCGFPFVESVITTTTPTSITYGEIFSTMDATIQWDLLKRNREFWKPKSCNTTTWALYVPCPSWFSLEVSSLFEWLKCVLYYPLALIIGVKMAIITYNVICKVWWLIFCVIMQCFVECHAFSCY
jgi:hypothetical protein